MSLSKEHKSELKSITNDTVKFDEPILSHSTIKIGGPSDGFVLVHDVSMLKAVMLWATQREIPYVFLGAASNTLMRDGGFRGLVIEMNRGFVNVSREDLGEIYLSVGASLPTGALVRFATDAGLSGVEFLAGIPGTVGGNIITNAGTLDGAISDVVEEITVVDRQLRELTIKRKALEFSYRKLKMPKSTAVINALLKLKREETQVITSRVDKITEKRRATQPYGAATLGCVFKNPSKEKGGFASAGNLIDEAGLKGVRVGKARVSDVHANFIVNEGGATAKDVEILIGLIKERVKEKFGIILEPEIHIMGEAQ